MLPVAVDAMGGDHAPGAVIEGARRAVDDLGIPVVLVGRPEDLGEAGDLPIIPASEVIAMDADPGQSVRRMKDSSLVRAAEAVRDGKASAMLSAGNTGATMASALLRMGRLKGVSRPAIATPIPNPGSTPTTLLDAGANAECQPEWLVQFAQMGVAYTRERFGIDAPRVAVLSIGEEAGKGNALTKDAHHLLATTEWNRGCGGSFVGNVEGRDLMVGAADVVVTDGFTGNVALKCLEGGMKRLIGELFTIFGADDEAKAAAEVLMPRLLPLAEQLTPDTYGGALLLGVDGVCIISHGSSTSQAITNAISVGAELVRAELVSRLQDAIRA